ncbi:MAG: methionyl-tRNA formyltransferase [Deltaproteobacteria bacterium]|nr:methionyl-tRNA formyltransferase [Deltaproteobacteria bacterium]
MGTPPFACVSLQSLLGGEDPVVGIITQPDRPKGRGRKVAVSPVKTLALENGLPLYQPEKINKDEPIELIKELSPDLIVVAAFGQILPQRILDIPKHGCLNVHASLLPKYRGAAPINWAIIKGETRTGITTMLMDKGLDTGDILLQWEIDIYPDETAGELHDRLAALGAEVLQETIQEWKKGAIAPRKQDESKASFAPSFKKGAGRINWDTPADLLHNHIRGMNPFPGAYTLLEGKMLRVFEASPHVKEVQGLPGIVVGITDDGISVSTGRHCLLLKEVQQEGRRRMPAAEFLRGKPIPIGTRFD